MGFSNLENAWANLESQYQKIKSELEITPEKSISNLESQYDPIVESNLTNKSSIYSLSSLTDEPQEVNYMPDNNVLGFKANKEYKSPSDIIGYQAGWGWDPTTSRYEGVGVGLTGQSPVSVQFSGTPHSFATPGTAQSGLAPPSASVSTQWIPSTDYYDTGHTRNTPFNPTEKIIVDSNTNLWNVNFTGPFSDYSYGSLHSFANPSGSNLSFTTMQGDVTFPGGYSSTNRLGTSKLLDQTVSDGTVISNKLENVGKTGYTFGNPVNFMHGNNSYYTTISPEVPGFTLGFGISKLGDNPSTTGTGEVETDFELGIPSGYAFGAGQLGNSRYIQSGLTTSIPTGTHTSYHDASLTFTDISGQTGVDFLSAVSNASYGAHTYWTGGSGSMSGFDIGFTSNYEFWAGNGFGSSKYSGMMDPDTFDATGITGTIYSGRLEDIYTTDTKKISFGDNQNFMVSKRAYTQNDYFMKWVDVLSGSNYMGMPIGADDDVRKSTSWNSSTNYYDSTYTINNPMSTNIWGGVPTSFAAQTSSGVNFTGPFTRGSYGGVHSWVQQPILSGSNIGFTTYYNPSFPGGYSQGSPNGNSKILTQVLDESGEHVLSSRLEDIYTTTGGNTNTFGTTVDFMTGKSLHEYSLANSGSISGFTKYSMPYSKGSVNGNSEFMGMWWTDPESETPSPTMLTSLWTGMDENYNVMGFPGPYGGFDLHLSPLSASNYDGISDDPLGRTWDPSTTYYDTESHSRNVPPAESMGSNLELDNYALASHWDIESGANVNVTKGSTKGGQSSPQFDKLYNKDNTVKSETDSEGVVSTVKYLGWPQDGSNIPQIERFNLASSQWVVNPNRVGGTGETIGTGLFRSAISWLIQEGSIGGGWSKMSWNTGLGDALSKGHQTEPYVNMEIGSAEQRWTDQYMPISRLQQDVERVGKFMSSQMGEMFIANQQLLGGFQQYQSVYDPSSTMLSVATPSEGLGTLQINFRRDTGTMGGLASLIVPATYSDWLDTRGGQGGFNEVGEILQSGGRSLLTAEATYAEKETTHKPFAFSALDWITGDSNSFMSLFSNDGPKAKDPAGVDKSSGIYSKKNMQISMGTTSPLGDLGKGDPWTLFPIEFFAGVGIDSSITLTGGVNPNSSTEGMPFYFRDLRDGAIIFFRAYITGLSETVTPSWNSENYVGRSEPVYTYTNAEREVNFTLKLAAQTKDELNMIYVKLNRLTSLCYPEYHEFEDPHIVENDEGETVATIDSKVMMKPPMIKFRLGELFGSPMDSMSDTPSKAEAIGFIKSLSYNYPDESPWEIQEGYRVPKIIEVELGIQIIHNTVPSLTFATKVDNQANQETFYGITKTLFDKHMNNAGMMGNRPAASPSL